MKEQDLQNKMDNLGHKLDSIKHISPSSDWTDTLLDKLRSPEILSRSSKLDKKKVALIGLIAILNIGYFMSSSMDAKKTSNNREEKLSMVSKEILINPTSLTD